MNWHTCQHLCECISKESRFVSNSVSQAPVIHSYKLETAWMFSSSFMSYHKHVAVWLSVYIVLVLALGPCRNSAFLHIKVTASYLWLSLGRISCSCSFSKFRAFGAEFAMGQARWSWGFHLARWLLCISNRCSHGNCIHFHFCCWKQKKKIFLLHYMQFLSVWIGAQHSLALEAVKTWWHLSTRGSAFLARGSTCWVESKCSLHSVASGQWLLEASFVVMTGIEPVCLSVTPTSCL